MCNEQTTFKNIYVCTDAYMYKIPINEKMARGRNFMGRFEGKKGKEKYKLSYNLKNEK